MRRRNTSVAALLLLSTACSADRIGGATARAASIVVVPDRVQLGVGQQMTLAAEVRDSTGAVIRVSGVSWTSGDDAVAHVSGSGVLTGMSSGSTLVTARYSGLQALSIISIQSAPSTAVATVSIDAPVTRMSVGQSTTFTATPRDAAGQALTGRAIQWSSTAPGVVSVASDGQVTAVSQGTATVTATCEGKSASVDVTIDGTLPAGEWPNQPTGTLQITARGFDAATEDGWQLYSPQNFSITQDANAPKSGPNVGQVRFPAGLAGGQSPIVFERGLGFSATTLYTSFWIRYSPNWFGHPDSGVNKILHFWIGGINRVTISAQGSGTASLQPQVRLQQIQSSGGYRNLIPNLVPSTQIVRGRWHRWELVLQANTGSNADGVVEWWIDGVKVGRYADIAFVGSTQSHTWDVLKWDPTWGGIGSTLGAEQYQWMDHLFVSGR